MISSVIGSVAVVGHASSVRRACDDRGCRSRRPSTSLPGWTTTVLPFVSTIAGPVEAHARLEQLAVVDRRRRARPRSRSRRRAAPSRASSSARPVTRQRRRRRACRPRRSRRGGRRRTRPARRGGRCTRARTPRGRSRRSRPDRRRVDRAVREQHLDAVLLVLVAEVAVAEEAHLLGLDALPRELRRRAVARTSASSASSSRRVRRRSASSRRVTK